MRSINMSIKLKDIIVESFLKGEGRLDFGRTKKTWLKEADRVISWFEKYYGGNKDDRPPGCEDILNESAEMILKIRDEFMYNIIAGLRVMAKDKYINLMKIMHLLRYMNHKYSFGFDMSVFQYMKWKDKEERLLMILKYLHSGHRNRDEIAEEFGISRRTIDEDIATLKDGFEFLGTTMTVKEEDDKTTYTSPVHPIFLALNSAEIYAMTVGLKLISKGTIFEHALNRVADHVYQQLSDFAEDMIDSLPESSETGYGNEQVQYMNSFELMMQFDSPFCQFLKERKPCRVTYQQDGEKRSIIGILGLSEDAVDRFKKVVVYTEDGELSLNVKDILRLDKI